MRFKIPICVLLPELYVDTSVSYKICVKCGIFDNIFFIALKDHVNENNC